MTPCYKVAKRTTVELFSSGPCISVLLTELFQFFKINKPAFECRCDGGYEFLESGQAGDGDCRDIDECKLNPCYRGVECVNTPGSFYCHSCPAGMTGNGEHCEARV